MLPRPSEGLNSKRKARYLLLLLPTLHTLDHVQVLKKLIKKFNIVDCKTIKCSKIFFVLSFVKFTHHWDDEDFTNTFALVMLRNKLSLQLPQEAHQLLRLIFFLLVIFKAAATSFSPYYSTRLNNQSPAFRPLSL